MDRRLALTELVTDLTKFINLIRGEIPGYA